MDYDGTKIPEQYDRARSYGAALLDDWMALLRQETRAESVTRILDLGCGTGRFSAALARCFAAEVIAIDPSQRMLAHARSHSDDARVSCVLGAAEALPLPDAHVDLVFISMAFHHFRDRVAAARECRRVLSARGVLALRSPVRERADQVAILRFFEGARALFEERVPGRDQIVDVVQRAGFRLYSERSIVNELAPDWPTHAERVALRADSIVASLPDDAFERGMRELRAFAARDGQGAVREPLDCFFFERLD